MVNSDYEKVVAIICEAHDGCTLCVVKQLAAFCAIYNLHLGDIVDLALETAPLGVGKNDLMEMLEKEYEEVMAQSVKPELLV